MGPNLCFLTEIYFVLHIFLWYYTDWIGKLKMKKIWHVELGQIDLYTLLLFYYSF